MRRSLPGSNPSCFTPKPTNTKTKTNTNTDNNTITMSFTSSFITLSSSMCSPKILLSFFFLTFSTLSFFYYFNNFTTPLFLFHHNTLSLLHQTSPPPPPTTTPTTTTTTTTTRLHHIVFGIASSSKSWPSRSSFVRTWFDPGLVRAFVFVDRNTSTPTATKNNPQLSSSLPPLRISDDTSQFPYTYSRGLRSAIRVARVVREIVELGLQDVRWVVLCDDDTVFVRENLVATLSKYDWKSWYYIGANSESLDQNNLYSFDMAFGGAGFAISYPLARVLAKVIDDCLLRYSDLYGSDSRVFSCLAELGVPLTKEPGFHQVDIRGDLFGMLSSHPLTSLISLHHLEYVAPIFPNMTHIGALEHLFRAVHVDPGRILQQTVCYDQSNSRTVSVSWGYSVQVYEGNQRLPNLLSVQRTFIPWRRNRKAYSADYMFNTRDVPKDPCKRPAVFFLESVVSSTNFTQSHYKRHIPKDCPLEKVPVHNLEQIKIISPKLNRDPEELRAPRRHCCEIFPSSDKLMQVELRKCKDGELISMH